MLETTDDIYLAHILSNGRVRFVEIDNDITTIVQQLQTGAVDLSLVLGIQLGDNLIELRLCNDKAEVDNLLKYRLPGEHGRYLRHVYRIVDIVHRKVITQVTDNVIIPMQTEQS